MGKNYNPADAFRKQQKSRELKKNAAERKRKREDNLAKQDTRELEGEITYLKSQDKLSDDGKARLAKLESELKYVSKLKDKYVAAHPEARDRIMNAGRREGRPPRDRNGDGEEDAHGAPKPDPMAHLYNPDGTLRDPKRSAYYDPTYNPFGVPPPGMPYRERSPLPGEESSGSSDSDDSDEDDDEDIIMPEGPRPEDSGSGSDSDDFLDIPLPDGPPPPRLPPPMRRGQGGGRGGLRFPARPTAPYPPRPGRGGGPGLRGSPRPPAHDPTNPGGWGALMPSGPPNAPQSLPTRPTGLPPPPSSLPAKPGTSPPPTVSAPPTVARPPASSAAAVAPPAIISAEPQLRDLRKEATVFVPRGVAKGGKRKGPIGLAPVNAAPAEAGLVDAEGDTRVHRPAPPSSAGSGGGLMGKLSGVLGPARPETDEAEDEYARFLEGME